MLQNIWGLCLSGALILPMLVMCSGCAVGNKSNCSSDETSDISVLLHVDLISKQLREYQDELHVVIELVNESGHEIWLPSQDIILGDNIILCAAASPQRARQELAGYFREDLRSQPPFVEHVVIRNQLLRPSESMRIDLGIIPFALCNPIDVEIGTDIYLAAGIQIRCGPPASRTEGYKKYDLISNAIQVAGHLSQ